MAQSTFRPRRAGLGRPQGRRGPRRDLLPGAERRRTWPRFRPRSAGTTGSSSTRRRGRGARSATTCWCRPRASTASRPAACWPTSTATTGEVRKFEGNPEHPGLARPQLRQRPGDAQPDHRPRSHPLSAAARRRARRGQVGAGELGRRARRHRRRASARRSSRTGRTRSCITSAGPARTASPNACSPPGASTATTRTPTSARQRRPRRLPVLDGARPAQPGPRQRQSHPADQRAPRVGPLLQPARPARHRGQGERREADRLRHAALATPPRMPTTGSSPLSGQRSRDHPGDRAPPDRHTAATTASSCGAGGTGRSTCRPAAPELPADFESFEAALSDAYDEYTFEFAAAESGVDAATLRRGRRDGRRRGHALLVAQLAQRLPPANLGGWQVSRTLFLLNALLGAIAHRRRHCSQRLEQVRAQADSHAAASDDVERADLAARVSARDERDVVPAAALPQGGPRQARRLLHPRLQPGVDQPRRLLVDRGAHRRGEGRAATSR